MLRISKLNAFMILLVLSLPLSAEEPSSVQAPSKPLGPPPPEPPPPPNNYGPGYFGGEAVRSCPSEELKPVFIPETASIDESVQESLKKNNSAPLIQNVAPHIVMVIDPKGQVIDTRFSFNRGSGDAAVDEQIMIWARQVRFKADTCKIRRLRFVEQPIELHLGDKP